MLIRLSSGDQRSKALAFWPGPVSLVKKRALSQHLDCLALLTCYAILTAYAES